MRLKLTVTFMILILSTSLFAQYNEKQIILNNASEMIKVRKYSLAEELYQEALTKFPNDPDVIIGLLELYIRTNNGEEGTVLLESKGKSLPKDKSMQYQITFLLIDRKLDIALNKAQEHLKLNSSESEYKAIGSLFQRYRAYSQTTAIFLVGEKLYPTKFSFDVADSYFFERNYDKALKYYLIALENKVGNVSLTNSRISSIIKESPKSILTLIDYFGSETDKIIITKDNTAIINVFIDALLSTGRKDLALPILNKYQTKDIYTKAEQFKRLKEYDISNLLYQLILEKEADLTFYYRYSFNFAQMLLESGAYPQADSLINNIISDSDQKYKKNVLFDSYLLKAQIIKRNKALTSQYETYLNKAEQYAYNNNQKQTLKAILSYHKILNQEFKEAKVILADLARFGNSDNYFFNSYLYELFQNSPLADSLATELIILAPDSDFTDKMLELKYVLKPLDQTNKKLFLDAYRNENLFLTEKADSLYQEIFKATKNEYFIIQNALMHKDNNNLQRARVLFSTSFKDEFCHDFAAMQLVILEDDNSQIAKDMARNFLTQYPNSSFAALVRQILMPNQNN